MFSANAEAAIKSAVYTREIRGDRLHTPSTEGSG